MDETQHSRSGRERDNRRPFASGVPAANETGLAVQDGAYSLRLPGIQKTQMQLAEGQGIFNLSFLQHHKALKFTHTLTDFQERIHVKLILRCLSNELNLWALFESFKILW